MFKLGETSILSKQNSTDWLLIAAITGKADNTLSKPLVSERLSPQQLDVTSMWVSSGDL